MYWKNRKAHSKDLLKEVIYTTFKFYREAITHQHALGDIEHYPDQIVEAFDAALLDIDLLVEHEHFMEYSVKILNAVEKQGSLIGKNILDNIILNMAVLSVSSRYGDSSVPINFTQELSIGIIPIVEGEGVAGATYLFMYDDSPAYAIELRHDQVICRYIDTPKGMTFKDHVKIWRRLAFLVSTPTDVNSIYTDRKLRAGMKIMLYYTNMRQFMLFSEVFLKHVANHKQHSRWTYGRIYLTEGWSYLTRKLIGEKKA